MRGAGLLAAALLLLAACGMPKTYAVLLPNPDGSVGKIAMAGPRGQRVVDEPREAAGFDPDKKPVSLSEKQIQQTFGAAMAAAPPKPLTFLLYFQSDTTELTTQSRADLPKILAEVKRRVEPDVDVIGHTDRVATDAYNQQLGLQRAKKIRDELVAIGIERTRISATSHGMRNPLVPTPEGVHEARNRRVEVTVR
ncbi:MAG TPA: OmpA family protein [Candidatus Binatia bacterium]|nr:OmpA family protein [Candidatus Binatia bacterium]